MPSSSSGSAQPAQRSTQKAPVCPVERECGACQHVGVPYAQQLASKDTRVAELFADVLERDGAELLDPVGMPDPVRYRHKAATPFAPGGKGTLRSGFYARGTHRIVPCNKCLVEAPGARKALLAARCASPPTTRTAVVAFCAMPWYAWVGRPTRPC